MPDRPVIRFGGQTQVDRPVVQFDRGPGAQRPVIRFGQPGVGAEPDKLDKGDFLPNLVGGLVRSFTSLPAVAVHAVTTPPERQALEVLQGMYEIGKGYYNIPRAYGNLVVGDRDDYRKFREQFEQRFYEDPLTYSLVGLVAGRGIGARAGAVNALRRGETGHLIGRIPESDLREPTRTFTPRAVSRAALLGWDPKVPEGMQRNVISVQLGRDIPGVGIKGTELVTRTLPRQHYRAQRAILVDRALKRLPAHWWLVGESSRAARALRKSTRPPYLALVSLPAFADADKAFRDMDKNEQTAAGLLNALPDPEDYATHIENMKTLGTPAALQTYRMLTNPKIRALYESPSQRMLTYNVLAHQLAQAREEILVRTGAATPIAQPTHAPVSLLKKFRVYDVPGYSHRELQAEIEKGGITEPIEIGVDPKGRAAILDGNHRIAIAERLGLTEVPFVITRVDELGKTKVPIGAGDLKPLGLDGSVGKVPEFEASPYRQTQIVRGGRYLTNSVANKFLRKTDADWRAAQRQKRKLVNEVDRFGTTDLREITRQTRQASNELIQESLLRGKAYESAQEVVDPALTSLQGVARAADEAWMRLDDSRAERDMLMRGELDLRSLDKYDIEIPEGHLSGRVGDTAVAQAIQDAVREAEQKEEKRILQALERARTRRSTSRELDELGLVIPSDLRVPTEAMLAQARDKRIQVDRIKQRLKEAKRFRLTETEQASMRATIDKLEQQARDLETTQPIKRSQQVLDRRMNSRYQKAEKILRKDLAEIRSSIEGLGDLPTHISPVEQKRVAMMAAAERAYRKDAKAYERLFAAENTLRESLARTMGTSERMAKTAKARQDLRERKITFIAGQRERARDLSAHQEELIALRNEIDASRGMLVGGGSPAELRAEFERAGRPLPYYRPDVMAVERPNRLSRAEGSITPPRPGADIYPSRSILFRTGQLAFHPDSLGPAYFVAAKHDLNTAMHKQAMAMAVKLPWGENLPKGYEYLRRTRGEKIPETAQLGGSHMLAIAREFEREEDLTTIDKDDADLAEQTIDGRRYRLIVPKRFADEFRSEGKKSNFFLKNIIEKPMDVWRTLLLHLRVPWLVNNILGNSFLYAMRFAGVGGLASLLRFYAEDAKTMGYVPAMRRLASYTLSKEDQAQLNPEQIRGTFLETSATGETPQAIRDLMPASAARYIDESRRARQGVKIAQGVPTLLPRIDKATERYLRRKASVRVLRGSQEVQDAYRRIRQEGGDPSFKEAVERAYAGDPNFKDYVMTEVNQALGDFLSLSRTERSYIRQLVPFYAWMREISRIAGHLLIDHPLRLVVLNQLAQAASEIQAEEVPEYMRGAVLQEKAGWLGALMDKIPGGPLSPGGEGVAALNLHGASPYATVTDTARGLRALGPFGANQYDKREFLGNLNPLIGAAAESITRPPSAPSRGLAPDVVEEFLRSIPQVQAIEPYPSKLQPDRTRADLIRRILTGDPRIRYDPAVAEFQRAQGR